MILVTGATGNVGREVVKLLLESGAEVGAVTRDPGSAAVPCGARVVGGDASRPQTLAPGLGDVEAVLLSPRAVGDGTAELLSLARERGAQRVVLLSAVTVEYPAGEARFADAFRAAEDVVKACGLDWTVLRCADFAANALAWAPQIRHAGMVRGAYGDAATSSVHERDIAEVAASALASPAHIGHSYVLTGPQSLTQRDKVRLIGEAIGVQLSFQEVSPEQVRQAMIAQGVPEEIPDRLLGSLASYAQQPGPSSDTVQRVLGRPALTFAQWAAGHAAAFQN
jgi:uncharacterized protein YbjT (DUF2867 family)